MTGALDGVWAYVTGSAKTFVSREETDRRYWHLYRVKVPSHRANARITSLILGRSGRLFTRFPRVDLCFPVLSGDIMGSTMGSTVARDLQSGRGRFETLGSLPSGGMEVV